jgi:hypothetical protein
MFHAFGRYQDSLVLGQLMLKCSSDLFEPEKSIRDLIGRFFDWYVALYQIGHKGYISFI